GGDRRPEGLRIFRCPGGLTAKDEGGGELRRNERRVATAIAAAQLFGREDQAFGADGRTMIADLSERETYECGTIVVVEGHPNEVARGLSGHDSAVHFQDIRRRLVKNLVRLDACDAIREVELSVVPPRERRQSLSDEMLVPRGARNGDADRRTRLAVFVVV